MTSDDPTTVLLQGLRAGDRAALDVLWPRVYEDVRAIARARLRRHRPGETLNTTAVVHEAYLKLTAGETPSVEDRAHFFALAARAIRFVLIAYARERLAEKRGGGIPDLPLDEGVVGSGDPEAEEARLLTLNAALDVLAARDARLAEIVELRFFGGMEHAEVAEVTGRSVATVKRDWQRARAWLYRLMQDVDLPQRPDAPSPDGEPMRGDAANEG
jgi:RNA polymerase sigma factor (TIGR02999 family)